MGGWNSGPVVSSVLISGPFCVDFKCLPLIVWVFLLGAAGGLKIVYYPVFLNESVSAVVVIRHA